MFDRILIPLDGSPESEKIRYWVAGLAAELESAVDLLAIIDPARLKRPQQGTAADSTEDLIHEEAEFAHQYLRKQMDWFQEKGVTVATHVISGDPADVIIDQSHELDSKLIAMTTRRKSALMRGVMGSVADRVLHSTGVPIMLARPGEDVGFEDGGGLPRTIVVPLDGSNFSEGAIPIAEAIAKRTAGTVLYVSGTAPNSSYAAYTLADPAITLDRQDGRSEKIDQYLKRVTERSVLRGVVAQQVRMKQTAAEAINEVASESRDRMIVMTTHGSSGVKRWLLGSVADKVIRSSEHPVIVIPPEHQQVSYRGQTARRP